MDIKNVITSTTSGSSMLKDSKKAIAITNSQSNNYIHILKIYYYYYSWKRN